MAKKRVNPRRCPASMADVKRAVKVAQDEAINLALAVFLTVLCDKFGYDAERLQAVWDAVNNLSDSIVKKYVKVEDLKEVLLTEYGINIS